MAYAYRPETAMAEPTTPDPPEPTNMGEDGFEISNIWMVPLWFAIYA